MRPDAVPWTPDLHLHLPSLSSAAPQRVCLNRRVSLASKTKKSTSSQGVSLLKESVLLSGRVGCTHSAFTSAGLAHPSQVFHSSPLCSTLLVCFAFFVISGNRQKRKRAVSPPTTDLRPPAPGCASLSSSTVPRVRPPFARVRVCVSGQCFGLSRRGGRRLEDSFPPFQTAVPLLSDLLVLTRPFTLLLAHSISCSLARSFVQPGPRLQSASPGGESRHLLQTRHLT